MVFMVIIALVFLILKGAKMIQELEDLKTQVAASVAAETAAVTKVKSLEGQVASLTTQLAAAQAAAIQPADLASLVQAKTDLAASATALAAA